MLTLTPPPVRLIVIASGLADILADRRGDALADLVRSRFGGTGIWDIRYGEVAPS